MAGDSVVDRSSLEVLSHVAINKANVCAAKARQRATRLSQKQIPGADLEERRKTIKAGITYKANQALVIWCPLRQIRPDIVVTLCGHVDSNVEIRNRWIPDEDSNRMIWGGALAIFSTVVQAFCAYFYLRKHSNIMHVVPFSIFIHLFIEAEILYPKFGKPATRIQISGKKCFDPNNIFFLEMELHKFGTVENIKFREDVSKYGIVCEVDYSYVAHALIAKTALNGVHFRTEGHLSVELVKTRKVKEIIKHCKINLDHQLNSNNF